MARASILFYHLKDNHMYRRDTQHSYAENIRKFIFSHFMSTSKKK